MKLGVGTSIAHGEQKEEEKPGPVAASVVGETFPLAISNKTCLLAETTIPFSFQILQGERLYLVLLSLYHCKH